MKKQLNYMNTIKITFIIILLFIASCQKKKSNEKELPLINKTKIDSVINIDESNQIHLIGQNDSIPKEYKPDNISDEKFNSFIKECDYKKAILSYYNTIYDEVIIEYKKNEYDDWSPTKNYIKQTSSDTVLKVNYMIRERNSYDISIVGFWIPLKPNIQVYSTTSSIFGDLDNDKEEDCIITVHTEGGWAGSNAYSNDIFVFLNKGDHYDLTYFFSSHSFKDVYNFDPVLIEKSQILGNTFSYADEDPRCCPTIFSTMKINLDDLKGYRLEDAH